jgi:hypothetical protein
MIREELLAREAWSDDLLADAYAENVGGLSAEAHAVRIPPALYAAPTGTMWLRDARGSLIRGTASHWERLPVPVSSVLGLAPLADDGAIILSPHGAGFELISIDARGRERWRLASEDLSVSLAGSNGTAPRLLHDERGHPYLHVRTPPSSVFGIDPASGAAQIVAELPGYDAPVLVWHSAVWRIQFDGAHRQWIRRPFGGSDEVILSGGTLDDTFLTAVAVAPDSGPVLTDGRRLLTIAPDGREGILRRPNIPAPAPPPPAVLDVLRAVPRPDGLWVVYADGAGWSVYSLRIGSEG